MSDVETVQAPTVPDSDLRIDDGGDHDRFAHYVKKDQIVESAIEGSAVIALCGKEVGAEPESGSLPGVPRVQGDLRAARLVSPIRRA